MNLVGKGKTAEVFDYGNDRIIKLFNKSEDIKSIKREFDNARIAYNQGIPSPKPFDVVEHEGKLGIVYEKLEGTTMLELMRTTDNIGLLVEKMVRLHKHVLSMPGESLVSYKDWLKRITGNETEIVSSLKSVDESKGYCHGDFHPGNIIVDQTGECKLIDFMNAVKGPPLYDIARTYFLIQEVNLPEDTPDLEKLRGLAKYLADAYLQAMGHTYQDIGKYYTLIKKTRPTELESNQ